MAVIALTATATVCLSVVFIAIFVGVAYAMNRSRHQTLVGRARRITSRDTPRLAALVEECVARIRPRDIEIYVTPAESLNAYTFGILPPKVVVLNAPLLRAMNAAELRFILGHELGHVRLGHTWLNSLVGGVAGIPSPFVASAVMALAFLWWNRACEYSADRAGLLACGNPSTAISALIKLVAGTEAHTRADLERALHVIETEDDSLLNNLGETLATHPMIIKRIEHLQHYASTDEYRRLQSRMNQNVAGR